MNTTVITITTEDGGTARVSREIRQGLAMPLCAVAPCHGRHADPLSAPLSGVVAHSGATLDR